MPVILDGPTGGSDGLSTGPCLSWASEVDLCAPCDTYDALVDFDLFLQMASEVLFYASAQQFPGECTETIRPCTRRSYGLSIGSPYTPFPRPININGRWENFWQTCSCGEPDDCGCGNLSQLLLPRYPIASVDQVKIDGDVLSTSSYRVDAYSLLVRIDGESWPCCQSLNLADTEDDTFSVTYTYGYEVPALGVRAAAVLACELALSCSDDPDMQAICRLPRDIASLSRQGVTAVFQIVDILVPRPGRPIYFGIPEIDMFLVTVNPNGLQSQSVVASPDLPPLGRITNTGT